MKLLRIARLMQRSFIAFSLNFNQKIAVKYLRSILKAMKAFHSFYAVHDKFSDEVHLKNFLNLFSRFPNYLWSGNFWWWGSLLALCGTEKKNEIFYLFFNWNIHAWKILISFKTLVKKFRNFINLKTCIYTSLGQCFSTFFDSRHIKLE